MHIKLTYRLLRRHLNHHRTYFYTGTNKNRELSHTHKKKHHPGFEPRTTSEGQQPTCARKGSYMNFKRKHLRSTTAVQYQRTSQGSYTPERLRPSFSTCDTPGIPTQPHPEGKPCTIYDAGTHLRAVFGFLILGLLFPFPLLLLMLCCRTALPFPRASRIQYIYGTHLRGCFVFYDFQGSPSLPPFPRSSLV